LKGFRDLRVWLKAHELTLKVYTETVSFPKEELYGLTSQIRRCSASIAANIAEGVEGEAMASFIVFFRLLRVRQVNLTIISCLQMI